MPLAGYGVLKASAQQRQLATSSSPHYQVLCEAAGEPYMLLGFSAYWAASWGRRLPDA